MILTIRAQATVDIPRSKTQSPLMSKSIQSDFGYGALIMPALSFRQMPVVSDTNSASEMIRKAEPGNPLKPSPNVS